MTRCVVCGVAFDEPYVEVYQDRLDGYPCTLKTRLCPICGASEVYFDEVEECDYCGGWKNAGTDMCNECHESLMAEVAKFLASFDPAQIMAIDYQLDGTSLVDFIGRFKKGG